MGEPQFSICVIARNEEHTLPRLIDSLKDFKNRGGEIVVLDTGSTDNTAKIARESGCVVEEVGEKFISVIDKKTAERINDRFIVKGEEPCVKEGDRLFRFADARNYAASLAKNDIVSMPDADEIFTRLDIDYVNQMINEGYTQLEFNFVFSHDQFGNEAVKFRQCKMYDRRVMQWRGYVHETLIGDAKRTFMSEDRFKIEHYQNEKTNRSGYLKGLALDCFQNPDNDRNSHYFARELMWSGKPKSAIKEFQRHVDMDKWASERAQSLIFIGDCYGKLNDPVKQVLSYSTAFHVDSSRNEALIRLAGFYQHNGNHQAAVCFAKAALEIPLNGFYANDVSNYREIPHQILYRSYGWLGNIGKAQEHLSKCLEYQPLNKQYLEETKYYFEYPDSGIDGWMTFQELQWLYNTAKTMRTIAEVGSFKGRSTHALLSGCKGTVTAIDHFKGSQDEKDGTHGTSPYEDFIKNVGHFKNLEVKKMSGDDAAKEVGMKYDAVFLDGGHAYDEVVNDIRTWMPKTRMILCGHDYCDAWPDVMRAVNDELGEVKTCGSIWYKYMVPTVSFIIPQLGREEGLKKCIDSIKSLNYPQELIEIEVIEGSDTVPQKVKQGVEETSGKYIVYAANDMTFEPDCIINALQCKEGLVSFNEGPLLPDKGNICTHFMIRRDFIPLIDEIFCTRMRHCGVDNLLWAKAKKLGEAVWCEEAKINHNHFSKTGVTDEIYDKGWRHAEEDRRILEEEFKKI